MKLKIVCLCGSTKFRKEYEEANMKFTFDGYIVLSVGCFTHADGLKIGNARKRQLDILHLEKINMADEIFVINKDGYIGESTRYEIQYAKILKKPIKYLEPINI